MRRLAAFATGSALLGGFLGALHPLGDSLAVFRVPLAVVFALAVIWTDWPRPLRWPLAGLALLLLGWHAWQGLRPQEAGRLILYQQNLRFDRAESAEWLEAVRASGAEVVTLQEVSPANLPLLDALRDLYPHQQHCPVAGFLGEAVLSRLPVEAGSGWCSARDGVAGLRVQTWAGPVWVLSVHLEWPWPHGQARQVDALLPALGALEGPVVVGGDFNAVAWSHTVRRIGLAVGAARIGRHGSTFRLPKVGFPVGIAHVLGPAGGAVAVQPRLGSDHQGLLARVGMGEAG